MCTRLGVDRSRRVLHGALIDCELLGGVYLKMTQEQFSLNDQFEQVSSSVATANTRPRPKNLKVQRASEAELAAHEEYLNALDKSSNGATVYRRKTEVPEN